MLIEAHPYSIETIDLDIGNNCGFIKDKLLYNQGLVFDFINIFF